MKITRSRIIGTAVLVIVVLVIVFQLRNNRNELKNDIAFAQRNVEKIPIKVDTVHLGSISENVIATGVLEASEVLNLLSETQGRVIRKYKQKGDRVTAGEVIVKVDDEVIAANVLTAEANFAQYEKDIERLTRLAQEDAVTKHDLEQTTIAQKKAKADLINSRKALSNTSIKAPISGYINNDYVTEGQLLNGNSQVCEIVNNNSLKLNIRITEHEVYKIKPGQTVSVHLTAFPATKFTGHITSIAEKADAAMKFNVEIYLKNDEGAHLRSGLYAEAELPVKNEDKLIIDKNAIVGSMENPVVFVVMDNKAIKRQIIIGQSNDAQIEVLKGLSNKDLVVISGQLNLKDGDDVSIVK